MVGGEQALSEIGRIGRVIYLDLYSFLWMLVNLLVTFWRPTGGIWYLH